MDWSDVKLFDAVVDESSTKIVENAQLCFNQSNNQSANRMLINIASCVSSESDALRNITSMYFTTVKTQLQDNETCRYKILSVKLMK